jgi:hypothetical protein
MSAMAPLSLVSTRVAFGHRKALVAGMLIVEESDDAGGFFAVQWSG